MFEPLNVRLITQERVLFDGPVQSVVLPAVDGYLGIRPKHAPLMAALGAGVLKILFGKERTLFALFGGFAQIKKNQLIILADIAIAAKELDYGREEEQLSRIRMELDAGGAKGEEKAKLFRQLTQARVLSKAARQEAEVY